MTGEQQPKPFDRNELQPCAGCKKGVMNTGDIHFYEVTIGQCIADLKNIQHQHGLEVMMGGAAPLAQVFAASTNVAHRLEPTRLLLCSRCAMGEHNVMLMAEGL